MDARARETILLDTILARLGYVGSCGITCVLPRNGIKVQVLNTQSTEKRLIGREPYVRW